MKKKIIVIISSICALIIGSWIMLNVGFDKPLDIEASYNEENFVESTEIVDEGIEITSNEIIKESSIRKKACISGEVKNPGVYEINDGDRIIDLIEYAGGVTDNAEIINVNLAKYINDEDFIVIPNKELNKELNKTESVDKTEVSTQNSSSGLININNADKEALKSLDGIGDKIAQNIIDYRNSHNGFKSIDEIKNVNRIGNSIFESIKDKITV